MSLDLYIITPEPVERTGTGVYVRENGKTVELKTIEEVKQHFPDADISSIEERPVETNEFWHGNITHNLGKMAKEVQLVKRINAESFITLYDILWKGEVTMKNKLLLVDLLSKAVHELEDKPTKYQMFNPENGWGTYEQLLHFTKDFLKAVVNAPEGSYIEIDK